MLKLIKNHIRGLITEYKRRNFTQYYIVGECIRMFIERESQKSWINIDGSYVMIPKWYFEEEVDEQKLARIINESKGES